MINQNRTYKIALVGDCLADGGAEKVHSLLSVYFANAGFEVHNCIYTDRITYSYSGSLCNIGTIAPESFFIIRKIKRFLAFRHFIQSNHFDYIIDFRMRPRLLLEFLNSRAVYPNTVIYRVASGIMEFYFPKSAALSQLIYGNKRFVAVSKVLQETILSQNLAKNVAYIHNPVDFESIGILKDEFQPKEQHYILAVGRMSDGVKQFDQLIEAYAKSVLPSKNISLVLLGEGNRRNSFIELAQKLGIGDKVIFKDFVENPFPYYKNALFSILSSSNEGFPNVLVEALACETPVVAFDCFSGPNEIIADRHNGLLVENQDFEKLTQAMNEMVENESLYQSCKQNALSSVAKFSLEKIGAQWLQYLQNNVS